MAYQCFGFSLMVMVDLGSLDCPPLNQLYAIIIARHREVAKWTVQRKVVELLGFQALDGLLEPPQ